jgi:hypothetical protein
MEMGNIQNVVSEYLSLLDLVYDVAQSIKGTKPTDYKMPDCQQLATKLFFHAATIYYLRQGTKAPVPKALVRGSSFLDFASTAILTRAILETYLTLYEVFFEPISDDEKEFRYQLWLLSGFVIREKYIPSDPLMQVKVIQSKQDIQNMRNRISVTKYFKSLSRKKQKDVLKGKRMQRNWEDVAKAAGFGEISIKQMYGYFSGFSHSDGLSCTQIVTATTKQDQLIYIDTQMRIILMVMSKMILNYCEYFSESKKACDSKPESFQTAIVWSEIAKRIP